MILPLLIFLPLFGGLFCFFIRRDIFAWAYSLIIVLIEFLLLFFSYQKGISEFRTPWIEEWGLYFNLKLDGLAIVFIALSYLMAFIAIISSKEQFDRPGFYFGNMLFLISGVNGILLASDLLLFFIAWEAMILPLYFLVLFWGHGDKRPVAMQFFIFTQSSGLIMLAAIIGLYFLAYVQTGIFSFDKEILSHVILDEKLEITLCLGFLIAFLVKLPACPLHIWIANLFCSSPTGALLVGIMVKTGAYAIIRFIFDLFPNASVALAPIMISIGLFSVFYGSFLAYAQNDIRKILAYSTVSHMGLVLIALFCHHEGAHLGAIILILASGISTGSLLLLFSELKRFDINEIGGIFAVLPKMGAVTIFLVMASIGLPIFGNFVGEWFIIAGAFATNKVLALFIALALVTGAIYYLRLLKLLLFGKVKGTEGINELSKTRLFLYGGLISALLFMGLYPKPILSVLYMKDSSKEGTYD